MVVSKVDQRLVIKRKAAQAISNSEALKDHNRFPFFLSMDHWPFLFYLGN